MSEISFPGFFVLGAPKAGTTAFCEYLNTHPQICLSSPKETRYFLYSSAHQAGPYRRKFYSNSEERVCGEGTPNYLGMTFVFPRLVKMAPDAQLFVLLREPAERAFSSWWMRVSWGQEFLGFEQALRACLEQPSMEEFLGTEPERQYRRIRSSWKRGKPIYRGYLHYGLYGPQLAKLKDFFPRSQIHVVWSECLAREPERVLGKAFTALGLDPQLRRGGLGPRWQAHGVRTAVCRNLIQQYLHEKLVTGRAFNLFSTTMRRLGDRPLRISRSSRQYLREFYEVSDQILAREVGEKPPWRRS